MTMEKQLTLDEVCELIGFSRTHTNRLRKLDDTFPKPYIFGKRKLFWREADIASWKESKKLKQ